MSSPLFFFPLIWGVLFRTRADREALGAIKNAWCDQSLNLVPSAETEHQLQPPFPSAQIYCRSQRSSPPNFPSSTPSPQLQQVPLLKPQATLARKPGRLSSDFLLSASPNSVPQSQAQLCSRTPWATFPASLLPSPTDPTIVSCNPSSLWPHAQGIIKTSSNLPSPNLS